MMAHPSLRPALAVGEAMLELAPVGDGLYRRGYAGDTFNTIWHMAQLLGSAATTRFVTRVGSDSLSEAFVVEMAGDGLDVSGVARDAERGMGLYLIELDGAERSFHYWRSVSAARHLADDPGALAASLDGAGLVHLSGITLAILPPAGREVLFAALAAARRTGTTISFDPNIRPRLWASADEIYQTIGAMLAITDIALPSFDDEATHWGDRSPEETIARFAASGVREIVVKNGAGSVCYRAGDVTGERPTPPVEGIRDTTGAGDAFNAGYLAGRLVGLSVETSVSHGQALSAEVLRIPGARAPKDAVRTLGRTLSGA